MMKKVIFGLFAATLLLYSCGTTKTDKSISAEPPEPIEETIEETALQEESQTQEDESDLSQALEQVQETEALVEESETEESETTLEDLYPPLDEIQEPSVTEITIEEIQKQEELQKEAEELQDKLKQQLIESLPEEETIPPVLEEETPELSEQSQEETEASTEENPTEQTKQAQAEESETEEQENEEEPEEIIIVPSRSVTLKKGETLTVTYPGNGWIYMGSTSEYNNLASRGRKLGSTDTKYTLLAKEAGTQIHHFYKTDNLTGEFIDDYLEVIVLDKKGKSSTIVEAPPYAEVVPKKAETPAKSSVTKNKEKTELEQIIQKTEESETTVTNTLPNDSQKSTQQTEQTKNNQSTPKKTEQATKQTVIPETQEEDVIVIDDEETVSVIEEETDFSELLDQAKTAASSKDYTTAYNSLNTYLERSTDNRDEALYLLGQLLESDSPMKNIKEAINTYQTLCDNYPASKYWENANKRIIYLKRFYINIH